MATRSDERVWVSRLRRPGSAALAAGIALAVLYAALTVSLPSARESFLWTCGAALIAGLSGHALVTRRALKSLRTLARGEGGEALRTAAVKEVLRFADVVFVSLLVHWLVALSVLAALCLVDGQRQLAMRVAALGLFFGPLTALLAHVLTIPRSRAVVEALAGRWLSAAQVAVAAPKRQRLRARMVLFTALCVGVPALLTADLSTVLRGQLVRELSAIEDESLRRELAVTRQREATARVFAFGGTVVLLSLYLASLGGAALGGPMRTLADEASRIAQGDLAEPKLIAAEDEIWSLSAAFTALHANLNRVLTQLRRAGLQIGTTTEQILATTSRYEAGSQEQAVSLTETSATTEELARSAKQIAENAGSVSDIAKRTLAAAQEGQQSVSTFIRSVARMREDNQAIADSVRKLSKRVQQIGKVVEFINAVASKSDLLALSAELEGTKAGEVGRGFRLVAGEMRRLAENVMESTREIESLIEEIREATTAAVAATEAGVRATDHGTALVSSVSQSLAAIVDLAGNTSSAVHSISLSTQQQQSGTDQLAFAMLDVLRAVDQGGRAAKDVVAANSDLAKLAKDLKSVVDRFNIA